MRRCRRGLIIILLSLVALAALGQQNLNWQGTAAVARSGEFAAPGLYAASNAFPQNTTLIVQNAATGQRVQVTVVQRVEGVGNIFLLLSEEAGTQIGLTGSQVIRVQASVVSTLGGELSESPREEAYSADPDLNPALSVTEEQLLPGPGAASPVQPEQTEVAAAQGQAEQAAAEPEAEEPGAARFAAGEDSAAQPPAQAEPTPKEKRLQELSDRIPQKQLYMPPRQQEIYALETGRTEEQEVAEAQPPSEQVAEVPEQPPAEEQPEQVTEAELDLEAQEQPPRVSMPGPEAEEQPLEVALPGPEAGEPEKPSPEGTRLPVPAEESPLTMAPEEPPTAVVAEEALETPEAEETAPEAAPKVAAAPPAPEEQIAVSETLPSKTYFVQLGAYSTRILAERLAGDLTQNYTVTILPASSGGRNFYKVLVGPLNVDESGTLLYQFRSRGFKDAFIQYVE